MSCIIGRSVALSNHCLHALMLPNEESCKVLLLLLGRLLALTLLQNAAYVMQSHMLDKCD